MRLSFLSMVGLTLQSVPVLGRYTYYTEEVCTTKLGPTSVHSIQTTTHAQTLSNPVTIIERKVVRSTITITPQASSTTITATSTSTVIVTASPTLTVTATTSTTSTETDTEIVTETDTTTSTTVTTVTTTPPATTIPTSAGFTPIVSGPGYMAKRSAAPAILGRSLDQRAANQARLIACPPPKHSTFNPQQYPTAVICNELVEKVTKTTSTRTKTVTTTLSPVTNTATVSSTVTTTSTTTLAPALLTISTFTSTIDTTTTTTSTSTITTTSTEVDTAIAEAATPTAYAACMANNVIGAANGNQGIYQPLYSGPDGGVSISQNSNTDPTQCCISCQNSPNCAGYAQYPGGPCYVFTTQTCNGAQSFGDAFTTSSTEAAGEGYFMGNGNCGQFLDGGSTG